MNCRHLVRLAEDWRSKAAYLSNKYGRVSPSATQHVVAALETCAQELEDEVRAAQSETATPVPLSALTSQL